MFFPEVLLTKSGPLAHVWLAANQHKKLTKAQVLQDKINEDIQVIIRPEGSAGGPLALRLSGQLLLGVVRIYHRKAHYLHDDCNDALWKIKMVGLQQPPRSARSTNASPGVPPWKHRSARSDSHRQSHKFDLTRCHHGSRSVCSHA